MNIWDRLGWLFSDEIRGLEPVIKAINDLEEEIGILSDEALKERAFLLRRRVKDGGVGEENVLPEAFALTREAAKRTLKQRHFDVQLMAGIVLHRGKITEMLTGEGKTLAATTAVYLNALKGKGVHIVTVNDYLAKRDTVWMGQIYHALGLSVACLVHEESFIYDPDFRKDEEDKKDEKDEERDIIGGFKVVEDFLRPASRREAYLADITYGTNHQFGFDYLRDNLAYRRGDQVQRNHHYAIIDEVDSILIDEARTPLIISAPDRQSSQYYKTFTRVVSRLDADADYTIDEKRRSVDITEEGISKVEKMIGVKNLYESENLRLVHYLQESLRARTLYRRDRDYVVRNGEIIIVDEFTGRLLPGRRYSGGLHQAIEAKEGVLVKEENRTFAQITIQNYFRLYEKIAGMTGTAQTSAEEFHKVYNLDVVSIPTNRPLIRRDMPDVVYKTQVEKYRALAGEVKERHKKGQPILIGTTSIEKNEVLSVFLNEAGVPHEILNAKNHEREGAIIAQAGRAGAVTVATNLAGRGVDIVFGGNPPQSEEAQKVREAGGLHVIGTERHEARRIDNQLRGRSGRQGDPGSSQFFLALEDDLLRIFGGERLKNLMTAFNLPEDMPIESSAVSKAINQAQSKVEGFNFDLRKHLLDYDDVLNRQRSAVYAQRQRILESVEGKNFDAILKTVIGDYVVHFTDQITQASLVREWPFDDVKNLLENAKLPEAVENWPTFKERVVTLTHESARRELSRFLEESVGRKINQPMDEAMNQVLGLRVLRLLDMLWMEQLENLEELRESVRIRAYGQHDPLVEYRQESHKFYRRMMSNFEALVFMTALQSLGEPVSLTELKPVQGSAPPPGAPKKIGRNDPCWCGSGKKYKKCHMNRN